MTTYLLIAGIALIVAIAALIIFFKTSKEKKDLRSRLADLQKKYEPVILISH